MSDMSIAFYCLKICSNAKNFEFPFWYWNLILIQSEFYLPASVTKRYKCTQEDVRKFVGTSLRNAPSHVRRSQKNPQATGEERCQTQAHSTQNNAFYVMIL